MLLFLNSIYNKDDIADFDELFSKVLDLAGISYKTLYLRSQVEYDLSQFSHLLISGSELSAAEKDESDDRVYAIINHFLENDKAIYGICWGHQMLAKAILGEQSCRKTEIPEFGFREIEIQPNPLFAGIENPVFLESHYDEVCNLTSDFKIIATNKNCEVQAFQYQDRPIWGTQFHPEITYLYSKKMIRDHLQEKPEDKRYFENQIKVPSQVEQNFKIFRNFLG